MAVAFFDRATEIDRSPRQIDSFFSSVPLNKNKLLEGIRAMSEQMNECFDFFFFTSHHDFLTKVVGHFQNPQSGVVAE